MEQTEEELERFRQQWKEEVTARKRRSRVSADLTADQPSSSSSGQKKTPHPHPAARKNHHDDELEPRSYHDLEEKELGRKIGDESFGTSSSSAKSEPKTALEHYERAVEKEEQGNLGDSMALYRKAFKVSMK
jgi:F-box protein 9